MNKTWYPGVEVFALIDKELAILQENISESAKLNEQYENICLAIYESRNSVKGHNIPLMN